jgi:hypothetical protein
VLDDESQVLAPSAQQAARQLELRQRHRHVEHGERAVADEDGVRDRAAAVVVAVRGRVERLQRLSVPAVVGGHEPLADGPSEVPERRPLTGRVAGLELGQGLVVGGGLEHRVPRHQPVLIDLDHRERRDLGRPARTVPEHRLLLDQGDVLPADLQEPVRHAELVEGDPELEDGERLLAARADEHPQPGPAVEEGEVGAERC